MTGANRSSAVMQQKRSDAQRATGRQKAPPALDYFPTPPFATRALCEFLEAERGSLKGLTCWEPACGEMHMARPLGEYFGEVIATDVHRYGDDHDLFDFTLAAMGGHDHGQPDFVITNPPFRLAFDFIRVAATVSRVGFAMLVRSAFLEGVDRFEQLFSTLPPDYVLQYVERVAMLDGRLVRAGDVDPFAEKEGAKVSSATAYCWLVWLKGGLGDTKLRWLAPCRHRLERPGDYPDYSSELPADDLGGLFAA